MEFNIDKDLPERRRFGKTLTCIERTQSPGVALVALEASDVLERYGQSVELGIQCKRTQRTYGLPDR